MGKVIQHYCPSCNNVLTHKIRIYGQTSYDCGKCLTFGPWKHTVRRRRVAKKSFGGLAE